MQKVATQSETPLTDKLWFHDQNHFPAVPADFARRLERDRAALMEALRASANLLSYYEKVFGDSNFTDRHDDEGRCRRAANSAKRALAKAQEPI